MTRTLMKQRDKAAAILVSAAGLAFLGTGTAYAFWTTGGSGTGTADVGVDLPLTSAEASAPGQLYPGGPALNGTVQVTNPNAFPVKVTGITFSPAGTTDPDCTITGVSFASSSALHVVIASGATTPVPYTVSMGTTSSSGCQGAAFTAPFTLQAVSQ